MSEHGNRFQFTADRGDARLRLDQALVRRVGRDVKLSRTQAQQWIDAGLVELDGQPARRASQAVAEGTVVIVTVPDGAARRTPPAPEELALDVLFEDEHLLAINKPPGVVVHPTYKHTSKTLLNAVLWRLRDRPAARPGVLTRLDKDTSGLVLVALSPAVHATVQRDAHAGRVRKEYLAVVQGVPWPAAGSIQRRSGATRAIGAGSWRAPTAPPAKPATRCCRAPTAARSWPASWSPAARTRFACTWRHRAGRSSATGPTGRPAASSPGRRCTPGA